jgi:hypothetical protein
MEEEENIYDISSRLTVSNDEKEYEVRPLV